MTDKQLYRLCKKYGRRAIEARRRFGGLLPEVLKRRLYEKKGCSSIYVFAFKLAGMTREQVDMIVRLERQFEDKPVLHLALVSGEISPNKLIRIASIATTENQQDLFEVTQRLSKQAIDVFVKDYKAKKEVETSTKNDHQDGLFETENAQNSLPVQTFAPVSFDYEIVAKLSPEVKLKIKEMMDKGIDINKELLEFFEERDTEIEQEREGIVQEIVRKQEERASDEAYIKRDVQDVDEQVRNAPTKEPTRYIPAKIKKIIKKEYGGKCAKPDCSRPAVNLHHTRGFAIYKSHDPRFLKPLCRAHHEIEHMGDDYVQKYRKFK